MLQTGQGHVRQQHSSSPGVTLRPLISSSSAYLVGCSPAARRNFDKNTGQVRTQRRTCQLTGTYNIRTASGRTGTPLHVGTPLPAMSTDTSLTSTTSLGEQAGTKTEQPGWDQRRYGCHYAWRSLMPHLNRIWARPRGILVGARAPPPTLLLRMSIRALPPIMAVLERAGLGLRENLINVKLDNFQTVVRRVQAP